MPNPIVLTVTQVRNLLQLPERPYEDPIQYDGTSYYDVTHREICTVLTASGTASGSPFLFRNGVDYQITAGTLDWTIGGGRKPDIGSVLYFDYTYSRLGGATASVCVANAQLMTARYLGSTFPYASTTTEGLNFADLATYGASLVACREAAYSLATSEIDLAQKSRRGSVLFDDSKKTVDWDAVAQRWDERWKKYRSAILPGGMIRAFNRVGPNVDNLIFGFIEAEVFDGLGLPYQDGQNYGGIL